MRIVAVGSGVALVLAAALVILLRTAAPYRWELPESYLVPAVPPDNPMSEAKVELGRYLFYDRRLSVNGNTSCGTCHRQSLAFTDGLAQAEISVTSVSLSDPDHARLKVEFRRNDGDWQVKRTDRLRE